MKIVTFKEIDESLIDDKHTVEHYESGSSGDAQIAILDIDTIFDLFSSKSNIVSISMIAICASPELPLS